ncbi:hypothetical protein BV509_01085 [Rhodovulum sulfidophilum]|uniref:Uncharacterized protein n=1 Tax=Rhodovulum visakhapatnamense TaxID=364297 RepID=A0ABS1RFE9_9RHOB|nr:hypothetical protein [Rhodovulum visakhapatnamense]MBL3569928.1 hypothetical protein [Rhodovulum visakhapatnamense]MBL3578379.1 hypothetical protein [Rhodovulum visakhapatnamense]OLS43080.1 hypothetical protein BV509_01085 [Rhodovulum sulfidophilum]
MKVVEEISIPRWRVSVAYAALAPVSLIGAQIPSAWLNALTGALAHWILVGSRTRFIATGATFVGGYGMVGERRDPPRPLFTAEHWASRSPRSLGKTEGPIPSKK